MSDGDELTDGMALAYEAAEILNYLDPTKDLLRFFRAEMAGNTELHREFLERFWDKKRGDYHRQPGSRVNAFCFAHYFLALREEIGLIILRGIGPVEYLYQGNLISDQGTWVWYWQQGASGMRDGEKHGRDDNSNLTFRFILDLDPRLIASSGSTDCAMSPLMAGTLDRLTRSWGANWSHDAQDYGLSVVSFSGLLDAMASPVRPGVNPFGIPIDDDKRGKWLIQGISNGVPAMEEHLRQQIMYHMLMPSLFEQIKRAPVT